VIIIIDLVLTKENSLTTVNCLVSSIDPGSLDQSIGIFAVQCPIPVNRVQ